MGHPGNRERERQVAARMTEPTTKTYLVPTHIRTREQDRRIDVTGKSESQIERITMGLLRNMSDDWFVDEITEPATV
jgi:hypothetical protein